MRVIPLGSLFGGFFDIVAFNRHQTIQHVLIVAFNCLQGIYVTMTNAYNCFILLECLCEILVLDI